MGKRELLLIGIFLVVGVVVYQATAPPRGPEERGLSLSKLIDHVRREVAGNRAAAELTTTAAIPVDAEVSEIRVIGYLAELRVAGEDRADVDASLHVNSRAYSDEEARQYATETQLKPDRAGTSLILRLHYPSPGRQRAALTLKIPARMRIRVESRPEQIEISRVAGVEITVGGGETTVKDVKGRVTINQRGGNIAVERVEMLKAISRGAELTIAQVSGDAALTMEGGGQLSASELAGAVELESRNAEVTLTKLATTRGPVRVNVHGGAARLEGVAQDTRVDGRNAEIEIAIGAPAPIAVYAEGGSVELTLPAGGFRFDGAIEGGTVGSAEAIAALGLDREEMPQSRETRLSGAVNGGGPTITVRTTRAEVSLNAGSTK